jgi:hypothetical protein
MVFAITLFVILAGFCIIFLLRARKKRGPQAKGRVVIYALCCLTLLSAMAIMAIDIASHSSLSHNFASLTFWGETGGLVAFGVAWLVASRTIPFITAEYERNSISPFTT